MKKLAFIYTISFFLLFSCSSAQDEGFTPVKPQDKVMTFPYPAEEVWKAVHIVLAQNDKIDIGETDTDNMIIETLAIPLDPDSEMGKAVFYKESGEFFVHLGKYFMVITLKALSENNTRVFLEVEISKKVRSYRYFKWNPQPSNGYIERKFFNDLSLAITK